MHGGCTNSRRFLSAGKGGAVTATTRLIPHHISKGETVAQSLKDRFDVAKSKEMFRLIQSFYNVENNIEKAIRSWNGGMRYSIKGTQRYYEKVMSYLNKKQ